MAVSQAGPAGGADPAALTLDMLKESRSLHGMGRYKEAYEVLGQSIRFFYSQRMDVPGQVTNVELLVRLQGAATRDEYESVRRWLAMCGSVGYARYRPDVKSFAAILKEFSAVVTTQP